MVRDRWRIPWGEVVVAGLAALALTACALTPVAAPSATATAALRLTPPPSAVATPSPTAATPTPTSTLSPTALPTASATPMAARPASTSSASLTINGQGMTYSYPDGWRLKQETKDRYSQVSLEGPDGALLWLTIYSIDMEPRQLATTLRDSMKKQFGEATSAPLTGTVGGFPAEGYTMKFAYMSVPMSSTILSFRAGKMSLTLYTQAADEDLAVVQPGFDLVKNTFAVK